LKVHLRLDTSQSDRITIWIDVAGHSVNVLFEAVFDELSSLLDEVERRGQLLPVVLRSAKDKGFVVGADLRRILTLDTDRQLQDFLQRGQLCLERVERFEPDTIALIRGPCLGGGLELALACRHRIACNLPQTRLGMPEAKLGLMPGWGGTQRLIETVGVNAGMEMLVTGEPIDAQRAHQIGLVDAVVAELACEEELTRFLSSLQAGELAPVHQRREMSASSPAAIAAQFDGWLRIQSGAFSPAQRATIAAVETGIRRSREAGFRAERELFFPLLASPTARETVRRLVEHHA
jgi:3-hydroxyacyl-CoA dehydrogenase/enoyl-CoA hydratase/3-hydroxybutyryl-CoA epimerase